MLITALCDLPPPETLSARNSYGSVRLPKAIPPLVKKLRRVRPSQNRLSRVLLPKIVSMAVSNGDRKGMGWLHDLEYCAPGLGEGRRLCGRSVKRWLMSLLDVAGKSQF